MADEPTTLRTIGNDIGEGIRDATNAVLDFNISKEAIVDLLTMYIILGAIIFAIMLCVKGLMIFLKWMLEVFLKWKFKDEKDEKD